MEPPDAEKLPALVRALYLALTSGPKRAEPDPKTLPLLEGGLPADLHALLYAWTFYGQPSRNSLRLWDVFEEWDFGFSIEPVAENEMRRRCEMLAPGSRKAFPPGPYVQLGFDGGGHFMVFASLASGATFGPEGGEDWEDIDGLLFRIQELAAFESEPLLAPFLPADDA